MIQLISPQRRGLGTFNFCRRWASGLWLLWWVISWLLWRVSKGLLWSYIINVHIWYGSDSDNDGDGDGDFPQISPRFPARFPQNFLSISSCFLTILPSWVMSITNKKYRVSLNLTERGTAFTIIAMFYLHDSSRAAEIVASCHPGWENME